MTVKELRALLASLPPDMPVGIEYPDQQLANIANQTVDVRGSRVSDPFHKFAGMTKEIFVLEVF